MLRGVYYRFCQYLWAKTIWGPILRPGRPLCIIVRRRGHPCGLIWKHAWYVFTRNYVDFLMTQMSANQLTHTIISQMLSNAVSVYLGWSKAVGRVVRKPVSANLGLLFCIKMLSGKMFFTACVLYILYCSNSKLKDKQYKQKTSSKSYKTEIKNPVNLWLASIGLWTIWPCWLILDCARNVLSVRSLSVDLESRRLY